MNSIALKNNNPKFCFNCKYFILDTDNDKFSKCALFPIIKNDKYYLVNGINIDKKNDHNFCSNVRNIENMCGKDGKKFEKI
jgi:hypothetical protein